MSDNDFDSIFDGKTDKAQEPEPIAAQEPEHTPDEPQGVAQETANAGPEAGEPPAPGNEKSVPLAALEAVRKEKTDWKDKAIRAEERLKVLEEQHRAQPAAPAQQPPREMTVEEAILNERMNTSEMIARKDHPDMDEKFAAWQAAAEKNPALKAEVMNQRHPWEFVYQQGARLLAMQEIGDDPSAYRERVRQELLAELGSQASPTSQPQAPQAPASAVPTSLANARSTAGRSAAAFTGPRPFDELFKQ